MRKAFTLIELLLVVSILALLASIAVPTYQLIMSQMQLSTAATQVEELIRNTQQKTVTEQQIYGLTFTANATTIPQYLYNPANGNQTVQSTYSFPAWVKISQVNFSSNDNIRFSTSGAPNFSGNVVIQDIVRSRNRQITLKPSGSVVGNQAEY